MSDRLKSFLQAAWNEPRRFFGWLTLFSLAGLAVCYVVFLNSHSFQATPDWLRKTALSATAILLAGFALGFVCMVLAWIPPARRLLAWLLQRRFFVLACLVTLVALFYAEENWRGKHAWEAYKRQQEAKGEFFDFMHLAPPPVPDEQNFAMIPLFKPAFEYESTYEGAVWKNTNGIARLARMGESLPVRNGDGGQRYLDIGDIFKGTLPDFAKWHDYFSGNTNFPQLNQPASPAETTLHALSKFSPELQELTEAATRPYSRFPIHYGQDPAWGILLTHLSNIKGMTRLACVRSTARLEARQTNAALADLKLAFRLSDSIKDEPLLIDHLVRLAALNISLTTLYDGLARHKWDDASLTAVETNLARINLLAELKQSLRGERALGITDIDWLRRQGFKANQEFPYADEDGNGNSAFANFSFLPASFFYYNMINVAKAEEFLFADFDENDRRVFPNKSSDYASAKALDEIGVGGKKQFRPFSIFAQILFPALIQANVKTARMQICVDFARVACALERHRLAHGEYPETLTALTPQFIDKLPHDVINGQPLNYRRTDDGQFVLYSVGWNEKDDGGTVVFGKGETSAVDPRQGDWVWRYPTK
ncbi:MAG: hypothetical protein NTZ16_04970 [Verrucomicrobia bacterium]|nr:hypothetical protein [Verrucomicrobiota bacterium]